MRIEDKEKPAYLLGYAYGKISLAPLRVSLVALIHRRIHKKLRGFRSYYVMS
jgi:hypothetical protein